MEIVDYLLGYEAGKNSGGGGDIKTQTLTVRENGTFNAPVGVAYNKVIVEVETVPTGQIIQMMGKTAPSGYLTCDGTVYNIADYSALAEYFAAQFGRGNYFGGDGTTTFAVPDLRGEFLRGTGTNAHENQGNGAAVGVHQDGTEHVNFYGFSTSQINYYGFDSDGSGLNKDSFSPDITTKGHKITSQNYTSGNSHQYYTSRPTNTSVLYCIKT